MISRNSGFQIPKAILIKLKQQEETIAREGITETAFQRAVISMMKGGTSFILAVYQVFEEFFEQEKNLFKVSLACRKGCSQCCHTLITCTEWEIDEIRRFVSSLPRETRLPLVRRIQQSARDWRDYYTRNEATIKYTPMQIFKDWQEKPCPFLDESDGSCSIYPVRIMDCRTLTSLVSCSLIPINPVFLGGPNSRGPTRYRFRCETWATNLIQEKQQKAFGLSTAVLSPVTPVPHWLFFKRRDF